MVMRRLLVSHVLLRHGDRSCLHHAEIAGTEAAKNELEYWTGAMPTQESLNLASSSCPVSEQAKHAAASKYANPFPFGQLSSTGVEQLIARGEDMAQRLRTAGVEPDAAHWEVKRACRRVALTVTSTGLLLRFHTNAAERPVLCARPWLIARGSPGATRSRTPYGSLY